MNNFTRCCFVFAAAVFFTACGPLGDSDPAVAPFNVEWAACNIGASSPEEVGTFFAWAETDPKDHYSWDTYYYATTGPHMTKYNPPRDSEGTTVLEPDDDPATVLLGDGWRTPTKADWDELRLKGFWKKHVQNGVPGIQVCSKKDGKPIIFLPVTGFMQGGVLTYGNSTVTTDASGNPTWTGGQLHYWTSELWNAYSFSAWYLGMDDSGYGKLFTAYRSYGKVVRAVRDK